LNLELKSVRKQLYNQKVKSSKIERQLADSKDKLLVANDHISDLQHANKSLPMKQLQFTSKLSQGAR
jgi:septal ring factor EnvC (AmiA/AmiB activator)